MLNNYTKLPYGIAVSLGLLTPFANGAGQLCKRESGAHEPLVLVVSSTTVFGRDTNGSTAASTGSGSESEAVTRKNCRGTYNNPGGDDRSQIWKISP